MTYAQAALRDINKIREEYGLRLLERVPRGVGYGSMTCPLAVALWGVTDTGQVVSGSVGENAVTVYIDDVFTKSMLKTPPAILQFVKSYDNGRQRKYEPTIAREDLIG